MKTIDDIAFGGKKALVRVDFNVPLDEHFEVTDATRIQAAVPTIRKILADEGSVILMSHLGRPKKGFEERYSLKHIVGTFEKALGQKIAFADDCIGPIAEEAARNLKAGEVLLLENLRFHPEEEQGSEAFAEALAKLGDVYVNDAFGTAHRAHASTAVIAHFFSEKCCGYLMQAEIENADKVLKNPKKPFTAIIGGAKVSDKILILEQLLKLADTILIGGGMAYTFIQAQGGKIGKSILEADKTETAKRIMEEAKQKGVKLLLPQDTVAADAFSNDAHTLLCASEDIPDGYMGLDIGLQAVEEFKEAIMTSGTILWNGPMGVFEMPAFAKGTRAVAEAAAEATKNGAYSLIGGGDSAAAVNSMGLGDSVSYVSTGGGALLEYMEGEKLPGIEALD